MITSVLFYVFSAILILASLQVVTAKNPVHAVLFLVLAFVTSTCLWLMLNVEFLAISLIVIYVGAVMVLFLFVVMMLDIDVETMRKGFWKNLPLALLLGLVILVEIVLVIVHKPIVLDSISGYTGITNNDISLTSNNLSNSNQLGWVLYTQYSYPVELASLILLLGLVVAVALTLRKTDKNAKYQNIARQVAVSKVGRIEMIDMEVCIEKEENITKNTSNDSSSNSQEKK